MSDSYAYYCVDTFWEAKGICKDGFEVGNATTSCLGNPKLGKYCLNKSILVNILSTFFSSFLFTLMYENYAGVQPDVNVAGFICNTGNEIRAIT